MNELLAYRLMCIVPWAWILPSGWKPLGLAVQVIGICLVLNYGGA